MNDTASPSDQESNANANANARSTGFVSGQSLASYMPAHFGWSVEGGVATITLNRPERKNPLTFESYAELRDLFRQLKYADDVHAVVLHGAGDNFCSGGDVHEIIGPLVRMKAPQLLAFTRMTGDLVLAMRRCPQPIISAIDGVCAGAGAILAMSSDMRVGTARSKTAFLFNRVGLAGCDMGACAMLPRIIGQGRASELLYTGRSLGGEEALQWGFFNRLCEPGALLEQALKLAADIVAGPTFANGITKTMLHQEWSMSIDQAVESEAQAQAICMMTQDFTRAYEAFVAKQRPTFEGN
jgi:enoyl-CoA hydratase/carnithine racemase